MLAFVVRRTDETPLDSNGRGGGHAPESGSMFKNFCHVVCFKIHSMNKLSIKKKKKCLFKFKQKTNCVMLCHVCKQESETYVSGL